MFGLDARRAMLSDPLGILRTLTRGGALSPSVGGKPSNRYTNFGAITNSPYTVSTSGAQWMYGAGGVWTIKPSSTGRIRFSATGSSFVGAGGSGTIQGYYGTGTAPVQGATVPGGAVAGNSVSTPVSTTADTPISFYYEATGLTIGTAYWFDFAVLSPSGGIRLTLTGVMIEEF